MEKLNDKFIFDEDVQRRILRKRAKSLIKESFKGDKPLLPFFLFKDHLAIDVLRFPWVNYKVELTVGFESNPIITLYNINYSTQVNKLIKLYKEKYNQEPIVHYIFNKK